MKKVILLSLALSIFLTWCTLPTEKDDKTETPYSNGSIKNVSSFNLSWKNKEKSVSLYGNILSGINISWKYSGIKNSWNTLYYDNIFAIILLESSQERSYEANYSPIVNKYTERLWIENSENNSISIRNHSIDRIKSLQWKDSLDKELCTPHYEEWINYKPKTIEKILWNKKIYITYATFNVSGPDMEPFKNYQAEICFVQNDRIYTITIGDNKKYRKDIVEAFKFL